MDLMSLNILPMDVQYIIYNYHHNILLNKVLKEMLYPVQLESNIVYFVKIRRYHNPMVYKINKKDCCKLKKYNFLIVKMFNNKGQKLFCKYNTSYLKYCNNEHTVEAMTKEINYDYKYISVVLIILSRCYRYIIHFQLKELK